MKFQDLIPWRMEKKDLKPSNDPFVDFHRHVNRMFHDFENGNWLPGFESMNDVAGFRMNMDIAETDEAYSIKAELPGMEPKDVEIKVEGDKLMIRGEKHFEEEASDKAWHRRECRYGRFHRVLQLPPEADEPNIKATFDKGLLNIVIPKREGHVERSKTIPINT